MTAPSGDSLADLWAPRPNERAWDERTELVLLGVDVLDPVAVVAAQADLALMTQLDGRKMRAALARGGIARFDGNGLARLHRAAASCAWLIPPASRSSRTFKERRKPRLAPLGSHSRRG